LTSLPPEPWGVERAYTGEQRMSIPSAEKPGHDACQGGARALKTSRGVLGAPAVAIKRASAHKGDLSRT
jgi:hypothetical protein